MATWTGLINSNWSNAGNWFGGIPPSATEGAAISAGNVTVDTTGLTASSVSVFINRTVDVGAGGGLTVGGVFEIFNGSSLVARNGGSVSASNYSVAGNLIVGGTGAATASGTVGGSINLQSTGKLIINTTNDFNFKNFISGSGSIEKTGAGSVALGFSNSTTGTVTVANGTLIAGDGNAVGDTAAVIVNSPGIFQFSVSETIGSLAGSGSVRLFAGATLTVGGNNTSTVFSGVVSEGLIATGIIKSGTGTLTLSGANTYNGSTTVSAGVLAIANGAALGTIAGGTTVGAGTALQISGNITVGTEALTLNGTGISNNGALRNVSGANTWNGAITLGSETRIRVDAGALTLNGGINGANQNFIFDGFGNVNVASVIATGTGSVTANFAFVSLFGINTYTGVTTITNNGTIEVSGGSAIVDTGAVVITNGNFIVSASETIGSLAGDGVLTLRNGATLATGGSNSSTTFSGFIESGIGGGALTKIGAGTFTLSGGNFYSGVTTISAGTLALSGNGSIANSTDLRLSGTGAIFDISAVTAASVAVQDISFLATGAINFGGKSLVVTRADGDFGTGTINGGPGANALNVTMATAATGVSLAGLTFTNWTDGADTISITGNGLANTITGSSRADVIDGGGGADTINGGAGTGDIVSFQSSTGARIYVDLSNGFAQDGGGAYDVLTGIEGAFGANQGNLADADILLGDNNANTFFGFAGQDYIVGNGGADTIDVGAGASNIALGGTGNDTLIGGADVDFLFGNDGSDSLTGNGGDDWLFTGDFGGAAITGADRAFGGAGNDVIAVGDRGGSLALADGGANNDTIYGGANANDVIRGGSGSDYLFGQTGADTYRFETGDLVSGDIDSMFAFNSGDRFSFASSFLNAISIAAGANAGDPGVYLAHTGSTWIAWLPFRTVANVTNALIFE